MTSVDSSTFSVNEIEWLCPSLADAPFDPMRAFGMATWLWTQSSLHCDWPVHLLGRTILPAVTHRQFLLARDKNRRPIAFVSWAKFDASRERKYLNNPNSLEFDDWKTGDRIWFVDWIAPFGGTRSIARKIENDIFPDDVGHSMHVKKGRDTARIYDHFGKNVTQERKAMVVEQLKLNLNIVFAK